VSGAGSKQGSMHCSSATVETSAEQSAEHEVVASAREGRRVWGGLCTVFKRASPLKEAAAAAAESVRREVSY
jgi:hypothetical protein